MEKIVKRLLVLSVGTVLMCGCGQNAPVLPDHSFLEFWNSDPFNKVKITTDETGLLIQTKSPSGGLFLRRSLDEGRTYVLTLDGRELQDRPVTVRLKKADGSAIYLNAPSGQPVEYQIDGTNEIELLIYSDGVVNYALTDVRIEVCDTCVTDKDLRRRIFSDLPGLHTAIESDPHYAIIQLLDWTVLHSDDGYDVDLVNRNTNEIANISASKIFFEVLEPNAGGYFCGGHATFLSKVMALFDYQAFTLNFGLPGELTHVITVLAEATEQARWRFYILDSTYGVSFVENGQLVPLAVLLARFRSGELNRDVYRQSDVSKVERLVPESLIETSRCPILVDCEEALCTCFNPNRDLAGAFSGPHQWGPALKERGLGQGITAYMALLTRGVFSVGSARDPTVKSAFIELLEAYDVPFH